jgi:hypothetical protein
MSERPHEALNVPLLQVTPRHAARPGYKTPELSIRLGRVRSRQ